MPRRSANMSRVAEIFRYDIYNMTRHQLHMNFNIVGQKWVLNKVKSLFLQKKKQNKTKKRVFRSGRNIS